MSISKGRFYFELLFYSFYFLMSNTNTNTLTSLFNARCMGDPSKETTGHHDTAWKVFILKKWGERMIGKSKSHREVFGDSQPLRDIVPIILDSIRLVFDEQEGAFWPCCICRMEYSRFNLQQEIDYDKKRKSDSNTVNIIVKRRHLC